MRKMIYVYYYSLLLHTIIIVVYRFNSQAFENSADKIKKKHVIV